VTALSATELCRLDRYIDERLDQAIGLMDLAGYLGMSLWHFSRRFEAAQGATPHAYITIKRLQRAKDLLASSELPVVDIALEVGMTHSHLSRTFLRAFGLTPTGFRRQSRTR
jgi:AraC family transcriptional regulator